MKHAKNFDSKKHAKHIVETLYNKVKIFIKRLHKQTKSLRKRFNLSRVNESKQQH